MSDYFGDYSELCSVELWGVGSVQAKVEMYSKYERQKDKRSYDDRMHLFTGPQFVSPPDRIRPQVLARFCMRHPATHTHTHTHTLDCTVGTTDRFLSSMSPFMCVESNSGVADPGATHTHTHTHTLRGLCACLRPRPLLGTFGHVLFCSVLQPSSIRGLATPWTYFLH